MFADIVEMVYKNPNYFKDRKIVKRTEKEEEQEQEQEQVPKIDYGSCKGIIKNGNNCIMSARADGYCGRHTPDKN